MRRTAVAHGLAVNPPPGRLALLVLMLLLCTSVRGECGEALPLSPVDVSPRVEPLSFPDIRWTSLAPGFEVGLCALPESLRILSGAVFVILRIAPESHDFSLSMSSEAGAALSFAGWSLRSGLRAGINASMYLPDNSTSTGYMRSGVLLNNSRIGSNLGAFFVAGKQRGTGARAGIIERDSPDWRNRLERYSIVVQNYRLLDNEGTLLWPRSGSVNSIAAISTDAAGRIVFILCQEPLTVERFANRLKELPLSLSTVMYVEGGAQAGLFVRIDEDENMPSAFAGASPYAVAGGVIHVWKGRKSLLNTRGNPDAPIPNVIGVKRDEKKK